MPRLKECPLCHWAGISCVCTASWTLLVGLANGNVNCNKEPCPVPTCHHTSQSLNLHLKSHWEVSLQDRKDFMAQLKRTVTTRMLAELRATDPMLPLRSTLDLEAPQSHTADPRCAEAFCQVKVEGDLEDPQFPTANPPHPEEPCAKAFCRWQTEALAKELDETTALLWKVTQQYEALCRKGNLDLWRKAKRARFTATTTPEEQPQVGEAPDPSSQTLDQTTFPDHIPSPRKRQ